MGGYCSNFNRHLIYLPEVEEEKVHGRTKTTLNKDGKLRVYSRKYRRNTAPVIMDKNDQLIFNRNLRRRYSEHYNDNRELINQSLMFTPFLKGVNTVSTEYACKHRKSECK